MNKVNIFQTPARLDESTFEALFYEHYQKVYNVLFRLVGDRHEADDLAAETFWRLWERPPAQSDNIPGWLYRVATRLGYNALRSKRRREHYELDGGPAAWENGAIGMGDIDPARAAEQKIERARVRQILRQMPLKDVQVLILRHSGLAYKEIANVVGGSAGSIGTLLARAEQKFEALYRQGEKDAPK